MASRSKSSAPPPSGDKVVGEVIARLLLIAIVPLLFGACAARRVGAPVIVGTEERGIASWYGHPYHGRATASGEIYDMRAMTAAHRTLPFGTALHVENLDTGQTARVRVNDRGPFVRDRILDVSYVAGVALGIVAHGTGPVRLRVIEAGAAPDGRAGVSPAGAFSVQVGSFNADSGAAALRRTLSQDGFAAEIIRADVGGQPVYRVRSGRFQTRGDAEAHAAQLARKGHSGLVVTD
jgi:rare lipoprotein A